MKILGISCSPRKSGNTELLINQALSGAKNEGAEIELYSLSDKEIKGCDGCSSCRKTGVCHIEDDMQALYKKLIEADGIIFGTPVYFYTVTSQAKAMIDRSFALNFSGKNMSNKVGGIVVVAGSLGLIDALKDLYFFIVVKRMIPAGYVAAYSGTRGGVKDMPKANQAAWELGREMMKIAEQKFEYPTDVERPHFAFGTHTH